MLTLALFMLGGATAFVAEDLPDFHPLMDFDWESYSLLPGWNNPVDIDGDGANDLLEEDGVLFQRNGHFTESAAYPVPPSESAPAVQVWNRSLYFRFHNRIEVVTWDKGAWQTTLDQAIDWPKPDPSFLTENGTVPTESNEERRVRLGGFLHDINSDGTPEIVLTSEDGLFIYVLQEGRYESTGVLKVFPPMRPVRDMMPGSDVRDGPRRLMHCGMRLNGSVLTIIDREPMARSRVRFNVTRYALRVDGTTIAAERISQTSTEPMPEYMEPLALNKDGTFDYGGVTFEAARSSPLPIEVSVISISTDNGRTLQTRRSTEVPQWDRRFVDMDGDGDADMVVQRTGLFEGGTRELVTRAFTDVTVNHWVDVFLQDGEGRFSMKPDMRWEGRIRLDQPPARRSMMFGRYVSRDGPVRFGDFNGDKRADLALQVAADRIAVYLASADGFQSEPEVTVETRLTTDFVAADMDGDGRCDILLPDYAGGFSARIYLSREGQP